MDTARRVYVVGLHKCFPITASFNYAHQMFRGTAVLATGRDTLLTDELRTLGASDAMLAVSFSRYTRDTVEAVRYAAKRGAAVDAAITEAKA